MARNVLAQHIFLTAKSNGKIVKIHPNTFIQMLLLTKECQYFKSGSEFMPACASSSNFPISLTRGFAFGQ